MSRSTVAMTVVTLICFSVAIIFLGLATLYAEPDGLSVVSHGLHILPENSAELKEKMEKLAGENYQYWLATDYYDDVRGKLFGTVVTINYPTPIDITWTEYQYTTDSDQETTPVTVNKIIAIIPDNSDEYRLIVYRPSSETEHSNPSVYVFRMLPDQANELLELI
ncbi:hypothetical protein [Methanorbis rubei]|uniref:Uncharacterized protein n=1 Tax=Methanorbis rubei TaxID=3028300 RepID=A0AAE4MFQ6_9EURY|nr:hypothetical protein [Methanocorpusculaceae archaeon Cs1]